MINGQHDTLERHEMVNWFNQVDATYRSDLREVNELNSSRFDAKLEQRVAQLDAKLDQRVTQLDAKLEQGLAAVRADVARLDGKLEQRLGPPPRRGDTALPSRCPAAAPLPSRSLSHSLGSVSMGDAGF